MIGNFLFLYIFISSLSLHSALIVSPPKMFTKGLILTLLRTSLFHCVTGGGHLSCVSARILHPCGAAVPHPGPLGACSLLGGLHTWVWGCWCDPLPLGCRVRFLRRQRPACGWLRSSPWMWKHGGSSGSMGEVAEASVMPY